MEGGAYLTLEPEMIQRIVAGTKGPDRQGQKARSGADHPHLAGRPRIYYKKLIDQFYPNVTVLSFNDLDPSVQVQSFGVVKV